MLTTPPMPPTQADLDAIDAGIVETASIESTQFDQQTTRFRSIDDQLKARAHVARQVEAASTSETRSRSRFAGFSKGL